jgi:sec-independent protein translocase protein TatA
MPNLRGTELLIIILLVVLLFGAKRLPDAARGIGRSLRIFKAETKGLSDGEAQPADSAPAVTDSTGERPGATPSGQPAETSEQSVPKPPAQPPHQA